jgi:alpha-galactosidase
MTLMSAWIVVLAAAAPGPADEMGRKDAWVRQNLLAGAPPFSFVLGGQPSTGLLPAWERTARKNSLDPRRTEHVLAWSDPKSGLSVRCRAVEYHDFPTVEWTLFFRNAGTEASPILENLQALDLTLLRKEGEFVLNYHTGDNCSAKSYEPLQARLEPGARKTFAPAGGRPTNGAYPFYNLEFDGGGLIAVIGWPGQWEARFERDGAAALRVSAGQQRTRFKLLPGEEVRSPLVALQFWEGDRVRSQNVWRRWMVAHNVPRPGGALPAPFTSTCMGLHQSEASEIGFIDAYLKGGIKLDYWWMDAGWYPCKDWWEVGTWEPDPARFPRGIRAVSDHAHSKGMKLVLWFEPERVHPRGRLYEKNPGWLLGQGKGDRLLDLGNPEARKWLTDHIDKFITEQGVDLYRQDFNIDPLRFWRSSDAEDRQGITEIRYVEGYLAYWDELRRRHPGMLIDSCASGGRRNDLETLRRSVPLLRSDFQAPQNPSAPDMLVGNQGHTYGLSFWVPYAGTGVFYDDVYAVRSHLTPALGIGCDAGRPETVDWARFRRRIEDWKAVADCFLGDYYPLTPYSRSEGAWIAWQFDRPEAGDGMVQAFRRPRSPEPFMRLKLRGLEAAAAYEWRDLDRDERTRAGGRELMEKGLPVRLPLRRQAGLIAYRRLSALAAVVSVDSDRGEVLQPITLSGRGSCAPGGEIASYAWDFGDGASATGPEVEHAYAAPGTYTVKLTVKDRKGAADTASAVVAAVPEDTTPPAFVTVAAGRADRVAVTFSEPVQRAGAQTASNYVIDRQVRVVSAALDPDLCTVILATSELSEGVEYTLAVSGVRDVARKANAVAPDSRKAFRYEAMLAHWRLDDGKGDRAFDSSGNGNHGTLRGGPAWAAGLEFDGVDDVVETDTFFPEMAMPFSVALWVRPAKTQVRYADLLGNHGEPFRGLVMQQDEDKANVFGFGCGDGKKWSGCKGVPLEADAWQHVAVVCDGTEAVLYVNGEEKSRGPAKGPFAPNPNQNFKLGQGYPTGRHFHGQLRDVRLYRKALSAAEVAGLAR